MLMSAFGSSSKYKSLLHSAHNAKKHFRVRVCMKECVPHTSLNGVLHDLGGCRSRSGSEACSENAYLVIQSLPECIVISSDCHLNQCRHNNIPEGISGRSYAILLMRRKQLEHSGWWLGSQLGHQQGQQPVEAGRIEERHSVVQEAAVQRLDNLQNPSRQLQQLQVSHLSSVSIISACVCNLQLT